MITEAWEPLPWTEKQLLMKHCTARNLVAACGRQSGKTVIALRHLARELIYSHINHPEVPVDDHIYLYLAPTREQAKRLGWNKLKALLKGVTKFCRDTELSIETIFGSKIYLVGMDKPERIEGLTVMGCVIDEYQSQPASIEESILPTLIFRKGWCWRIGIPRSGDTNSERFMDFCEKVQDKDPEFKDWAYCNWASSDVVDPEELRIHRGIMSKRSYEEHYEASWQTVGGSIYYAFDDENITPVAYDPTRPLIVSSDFNRSPMSWILCHEYEKQVNVVDEIWIEGNATTKGTLNHLWSKYKEHRGGFRFYGDSSGKQKHSNSTESDYDHIRGDARFLEHGRKVDYMPVNCNPAIKDRTEAVNAMLQSANGERRLFIDPKCKHLIYDFRHCSWLEDMSGRTVWEERQTKKLSHATSALGYFISYKFPLAKQLRRPRTLPPQLIFG